MRGDQTLFARADWIRRAWSIVDPLVRQWESHPPDEFPNYRAGSWGPAAADELLTRDGRAWNVI
jgi:glucose-6-phosphate 1-dehydrogenase